MRRTESVMGTVVSFDIRPGSLPAADVYVALARARAVLHSVDAVFSTWKPNSPLSRLRRGEIELPDAPAEVAAVLDLCAAVHHASGGWFDPWAMPGGVDPTGLVKGWAGQAALDVLASAGAGAAMVNAGGDVATFGQPEPGRPWLIGIRHPRDPRRIVAVVEAPGAVATSGTYERGDHIVDPRTGSSCSAVASATVTGPDLAMADGLATALMAAGEGGLVHLASLPGYEALLVGHGGGLLRTPGLPLVGRPRLPEEVEPH